MRMLVEGVFFILFRGESSFGKNYLDDVNYKNDVFDDIIFFRESIYSIQMVFYQGAVYQQDYQISTNIQVYI